MVHLLAVCLLLAVVAVADKRQIYEDGSLVNNWKLKNPDHLQIYCIRGDDEKWIGVDMVPGSQIVFSTNTPDSTASNYKNLHFKSRFQNGNADDVIISVGGSPLSYSQLVLTPETKETSTPAPASTDLKTNIYNDYNGYTVRVKKDKDNKINIPLSAIDSSSNVQSFYIRRVGSGSGVQRVWFSDVKFDSEGDATDQYNGAPTLFALLAVALMLFL